MNLKHGAPEAQDDMPEVVPGEAHILIPQPINANLNRQSEVAVLEGASWNPGPK